MAVQLNHTIVWCRDREVSARFLAEVLGVGAPTAYGPFLEVHLSNEVALAYHPAEEQLVTQHYAFLVSEEEFDGIYARIQAGGVSHWADPMCRRAGEINRHDGGRGVYFADPDGHLMEAITRPYGSD